MIKSTKMYKGMQTDLVWQHQGDHRVGSRLARATALLRVAVKVQRII